MSDYQDLMTWCKTEAEEVLQIVEQPVTDRQQEYMVHNLHTSSLMNFTFNPYTRNFSLL